MAEAVDEGQVILAVNASSKQFIRTLNKLKHDDLAQALDSIRSLLFVKLGDAPAKLHLHPLKARQVTSMLDANKKVKVYTFHLTSNDRYKASFTLEDGTAYLRVCGEHDALDKNP